MQKKYIHTVWGGILISSLLIWFYQLNLNDLEFYRLLIDGLLLFFSLNTVFSFLYAKKMIMGGFTLDPEQKQARVAFFIGALSLLFIVLV